MRISRKRRADIVLANKWTSFIPKNSLIFAFYSTLIALNGEIMIITEAQSVTNSVNWGTSTA